MHLVSIDRDRPDFRVFIDLLYGPDWNVDTDGDSFPVSSRTWTDLYIADRQTGCPPVVIQALNSLPATFSVESTSERLEQLAALYLYLYAGTAIEAAAGPLAEQHIAALKSTYARELGRASLSRWHRSSTEDPYPKAVIDD